jgi:hypothetical protein
VTVPVEVPPLVVVPALERDDDGEKKKRRSADNAAKQARAGKALKRAEQKPGDETEQTGQVTPEGSPASAGS